jgi:lincosamide nucleotidyltransferase A/C/D/E
MAMSVSDVHEILDRLDAAGIEWWIDGGWGVDALLGRETRPHNDLDFAVNARDIERLAEVFPEFEHVDRDQMPAAYVLRDVRGRELDFHPLTFDDNGDGWQPQSDGSRAQWPRDALDARGVIGGREVRCTSAEFQVDSHLYEGYGETDWADVVNLCTHVGLPLPERDG